MDPTEGLSNVKHTYEKYKKHHIADLKKYKEANLPENHRRNIKKAYRAGSVYMNMQPNVMGRAAMAHGIYQNLVARHEIPDQWFTNYDQKQFEMLLEVPGAVLFQYNGPDGVEGISLFYFNGENVYYHLSAQTQLGYDSASMFAMMDTAFNFFRRLGASRILLGSVPETGSEGLERFKSGFCDQWKTNRILKCIFDPDLYNELSKDKSGDYFPLYRG